MFLRYGWKFDNKGDSQLKNSSKRLNYAQFYTKIHLSCQKVLVKKKLPITLAKDDKINFI